MRLIALALSVLVAGCASQMPGSSPVVAYPMSQAILNNPDARVAFASLVRMSGYGRLPQEKAAFLVLGENGRFSSVPWPSRGLFHGSEWTGAIPTGTVAIAHTHPLEYPYASRQDCEEARRLGIPIFVLTPGNVVLIDARGDARTLRAVID